ncbi:MAG: helix-turn-helix transcriptional regulator [Chloroflexota bacterium]|nr:helix-turn-helix transcriptional regulator [Chloroflexota bacterium]
MTRIKNKRQLAASKAWLSEFRRALKVARKNPVHLPPRLLKAELGGIRSQIQALEREIEEYDALVKASPNDVALTSLKDLPDTLVRMRIVRGLTQDQLAEKLNIKPQQIQRWEAGAYRSATYKRMLQVATALQFDIPEVFLSDCS